MKNRPYKARPDLLRRLVAAGCPVDIEEGAQDNTQAPPRGLLIRQVNGDLLNTAFDLDHGGTAYILDLQITSDVPGPVVIRYFELDRPWQDPQFLWLPDPADSGARPDEYVIPGTTIVYPRNLVINHRISAQGRLRRGGILDGLLLGVGFEPIPDCFRHGTSVDGTLSIVDQFGRSHSSQISLWINRSITIDRARRKAMPASLRSRRRLLEKADAL